VGSSLKSDAVSSKPAPGPTTGFSKRVLVVDPDQKAWELRARLLIALGHVVHRISQIAEAPPSWPRHLYDLVVVATEDPSGSEVMEFCRKLNQADPPVCVVLLAPERSSQTESSATIIACDQPAAEIAEAIAQFLR